MYPTWWNSFLDQTHKVRMLTTPPFLLALYINVRSNLHIILLHRSITTKLS